MTDYDEQREEILALAREAITALRRCPPGDVGPIVAAQAIGRPWSSEARELYSDAYEKVDQLDSRLLRLGR